MIAWRTTKTRYDPWDATGAALNGGRWHSPGLGVIYAADSFAGSLLEILAHAQRPKSLAGPHHAVRIDVPDDAVETPHERQLADWDLKNSPAARAFGDAWIREGRSVALLVPALPGRPIGRLVIINPAHPDAARIVRGTPFTVPWDERLF